MKHVLAFILILAIVAIANQFYVLGSSVALLLVGILSLALKKAGKILDMYFGMPTVWQNVQETLEIGLKFGVLGESVSLYRIWTFYDTMEVNNELFEIKINEHLVSSFESKYGRPPPLRNHPTRNRALHYFVDAARFNHERFPEILNAVQVRKRVQGKKQDPEKEVSEELRPMYA